MIEDVGFVIADEAAALDPGVVKILPALAAIEQHATLAGDQPALVLNQNSQALQRPLIHVFPALEILFNGFEIERFQCEAGHWQGIKTHPIHPALQLCDEVRIGLPVGGAKADIDAICHALSFEKMGANAAEKHLDYQQSFPFHSDHFDIRHQARGDRVGDQVGQPLFFIQRMINTNDLAIIGHTQDQTTACGICECHQGLEQWTRGRQVALELQRLAFRFVDKRGNHAGTRDFRGKGSFGSGRATRGVLWARAPRL